MKERALTIEDPFLSRRSEAKTDEQTNPIFFSGLSSLASGLFCKTNPIILIFNPKTRLLQKNKPKPGGTYKRKIVGGFVKTNPNLSDRFYTQITILTKDKIALK